VIGSYLDEKRPMLKLMIRGGGGLYFEALRSEPAAAKASAISSKVAFASITEIYRGTERH
jgi:hypothetical protein